MESATLQRPKRRLLLHSLGSSRIRSISVICSRCCKLVLRRLLHSTRHGSEASIPELAHWARRESGQPQHSARHKANENVRIVLLAGVRAFESKRALRHPGFGQQLPPSGRANAEEQGQADVTAKTTI